MDTEACLPVPSTKKHASRQIFFPSPVRCPKITGGDGEVKMWMHPGLAASYNHTHRDQSIFRLQRTAGISRQCLHLIPWATLA